MLNLPYISNYVSYCGANVMVFAHNTIVVVNSFYVLKLVFAAASILENIPV